MEFFTKKIFEKKSDEFVHSQFQKFSRGEFNDRAMLKVKNSSGKYTIDTTAEYARELVCAMGEKLGDKKTLVSGALVSALDLEGFKYESKSSALGVKKYIINREMSGKEIVDLCNLVPKAFFGLSFKVDDEELKIQAKSPKSAKGASSSKKEDEKPKIDFCKVKTKDKNLVKDLVFDSEVNDFKNVEIRHNFIISDIVIPDSLKNEKDFAKVREGAQRKGKIIRILKVDDKVYRKEVEFIA